MPLRVVVVGLGGLGCPASMGLATLLDADRATLVLVDDDRVAASNLQRQVLHRTADVGRPKVESARDALARLRPALRVETVEARMDAGNALEILAGAAVVIDATDGAGSKYLVSDACCLGGVPFVHGAALRLGGQLFAAPRGAPCLRCLFGDPPARGERTGSCSVDGILGPVAGVIGARQASRAIEVIEGRAEGGLLEVLDGGSGDWRRIRFARDPRCRACGDERLDRLVAEDYSSC